MRNIERYKDEIVKVGGVSDFSVVEESILPCMTVPCSRCMFDDKECDIQKTNWLCEEYKEPEIDWDNDIDWMRVPIGTEVIVHNIATVGVHRAKFAVYVPKGQLKYRTFAKGAGQEDATTLTGWDYCELSNKEDIEKYRKR